MKKIKGLFIFIFGVCLLGYIIIQAQQDKIDNSPEGMRNSFFADYEEVVSHEKNHFSDSFYSVVLKQEFFEKNIEEQASFLFKMYDSFVENVVSEEEKEEFDHINLSIYSEFDYQGKETNLFYGESNVYDVGKEYIHFNQLSGLIGRDLLIPHFVANKKEFVPTTNQLIFGLEFGDGAVTTLEEIEELNNEVSELETKGQKVKDSWTTSSGEDMTKMDSKEIEKELNKRYKGKSENYDSKGEYRPVDSMTQKEIQNELEDMLNESLK